MKYKHNQGKSKTHDMKQHSILHAIMISKPPSSVDNFDSNLQRETHKN